MSVWIEDSGMFTSAHGVLIPIVTRYGPYAAIHEAADAIAKMKTTKKEVDKAVKDANLRIVDERERDYLG